MSTVTYKNQPAIHKTRGTVPLAGTEYLYKVTKKLWPTEVEKFLKTQLLGTSLHICCGLSSLGDVRLDKYAENVDIIGDAARVPFPNKSFNTVLIDPPYNGKFQWNHDMLSEIFRVASNRVIFQHWYTIADKQGRCKKDHSFILTDVYIWQPKTYFGRVNVISIFDKQEILV